MTAQALMDALMAGVGERIRDAGGGMVLGDRITYSSSQTVNRSVWEALAPSGMELAGVIAKCIGGGGGGNRGSTASGGWGGQKREAFIPVDLIGTSEVLTIGAAGAGEINGGAAATIGGTTSFGALLVASGGATAGATTATHDWVRNIVAINALAEATGSEGIIMGAGGRGSSGNGGHGSDGRVGGGGGGGGNGIGGKVGEQTGRQYGFQPQYDNTTSWPQITMYSYASGWLGGNPVWTAGADGHAGVGDDPGGGGNANSAGNGGNGGFPGGGGGAASGTVNGGNGGAGVIYLYPVFRKAL